MEHIDVNFDFTSDSPGYWNNFWDNDILGGGGCDPDSKSKTLKRYHQELWSRKLPNGELLDLRNKKMYWKNMYFASDSILHTFRYNKMINVLKEVQVSMPNYHQFIEDLLHKFYTIGGMMIFPSMVGGINQQRGCNPRICDRWDLTMECIRRHYKGEIHPLQKCFENNKNFFDLFVDFKGFVDFFFLQDCVDEGYEYVKLWTTTPLFEIRPLPKDVNTYLAYIDKELVFLNKRNKRIQAFVNSQQEVLHLKISSEGGYVEVKEKNGTFIFHSDESSLADFLDEEDLKDLQLEKFIECHSLSEAISYISKGLIRHGYIKTLSDKAKEIINNK